MCWPTLTNSKILFVILNLLVKVSITNVWSSRFIRGLELNALYILFGFYINCTDFWGFPLDGVIDWWNRRVFFIISLICSFNVSFSMKNLTYLYQFKKMRLRRIMFGLSNSSRKLVKYNIKKNVFYTICICNALLYMHQRLHMYMYIRVVP